MTATRGVGKEERSNVRMQQCQGDLLKLAAPRLPRDLNLAGEDAYEGCGGLRKLVSTQSQQAKIELVSCRSLAYGSQSICGLSRQIQELFVLSLTPSLIMLNQWEKHL